MSSLLLIIFNISILLFITTFAMQTYSVNQRMCQ